MHVSRTLAVFAATASLCLLGFGVTTSSAHAQVIDQACFSASTLTLSPGLNNEDQSGVFLSGSGQLNTCLSQGEASGLTATYTLSGNVSGSCLEATANVTQVIHWNDGSDSTVDLSGSLDELTGDLGGTVESGLFAGTTVVFPNVLLQSIVADPLACESPGGLTSGTGDGEEIFTSVL
jgi:hypothetical protein